MIGRRFSAAAKTYDRHARPQQALAQAVVSALPELYPEQILELGAGTGQLTRLLIDRFPDVPIDAVDVAEKMVEHSRLKFGKFPRVNWIEADAQTYLTEVPYPLIASSAALHWVSNLRKTFSTIFQCLENDGLFALGMMLGGTLKELRELRQTIAPDKAPSDSLTGYAETEEALHEAGFRVLRKIHSEEQILYDSAEEFFRAIHEQGVTGRRVTGDSEPLTRGELSELVADYQERFAADGGVYATYETAVFLATR
ncbi:MAG: methyltransferase domain-containing protein [Kiritimatiellales bacterium]|nr:methyltransferase domain-containing protein [Kiritimatiellales bacterium]